MSKNFGYESNGKVCACGLHHGCGEYTPEKRAASAAHMRDKLPQYMSDMQKAYLASWEANHGRVHYRMEVMGKNSGEFKKSHKGADVMGAVYIDLNATATPDMFTPAPAKRADIHG